MKTSREINQKLIETFPEIRPEIETEISWQDGLDTGSTVVFEDVFVKSVIAALHFKNDSYLRRVFRFAEDMLETGDEYAINVIEVAFIEAIASYDERDELQKYMLPKTLESYQKCKVHF